MLAITVFFQMLSFVIMIGAGIIAAKTNLLDETANQRIASLILKVFGPMLLLSSASSAAGNIPLKSFLLTSLTAAGMFLAYIVISAVTAPLFDQDKGQQKIYQLMFVFSNLGFIGIPVVNSALGAEYVIYVTIFMLMYNLVFYTYGMVIMEGGFSLNALKDMLNSGTVFWLAAIVIIIFQIPLPGFLQSAISSIGNVTTPLALMGVGYTMVHTSIKQLFGDVRIYIFTFVKMLVLPLILLRLLMLFPISHGYAAVCLIMFGMPNGNMPLAMGTQRGLDCRTCTAAIVVTTLLSIVTIPVLLAVAGI